MKKRTNPFRNPARPEAEEIPQPKPVSSMTDSEIEEGIRKARREILDAQHEELRIREKARLMPGDAPGSSPSKQRPLSEVFSKSKRRFK